MTGTTPNRSKRRGRIFPEIHWSPEEKAKRKAEREAFYQRCRVIFERILPNLIEKYYGWYIAIEPDSGDYFIDPDKEVASQKARQKYPNKIHHMFGINETGVSGSI